MTENIICGRKPVLEAITAGTEIVKVILAKNSRGKIIVDLVKALEEKKVPLEEISYWDFKNLTDHQNHQGVLAYVRQEGYKEADIDGILEACDERKEPPLIAVLDCVTDPRNMGAIIRSAECAGAHGVIIPEHNSADINETVIKASAGATSHIKVSKVVNIAQTLEHLKKQGLWIYGTDVEADKVYYDTDLTGPAVIVLGSEGDGMRRLVRENCDFLIKIPTLGKIQSLNVSVAAGIVFFEAQRQRIKLKGLV